ncbi:MAG: sigma-70 family RNA polymerase sigma factor [Ktedonobacteraceae bacterium]|nr:sigma-70 family RNA polymerase sigma factor [Ktedonobacteraceae bacterium]
MSRDDALVLARAGNLDAWIELCMVECRALANSFAQSSGIAPEDLLQEVAIKLFRKAEMVLAAPNPHKYAMWVAKNTMIEQYRVVAKRRRQVQFVSLDAMLEGGAAL